MTETVSTEHLNEMLAELDGVTPGNWQPWVAPNGQQFVRAVYQDSEGRRCTAWPAECAAGGQDNERNAAHIAHCDPDTMRSILTELIASRALRSSSEPVGRFGPYGWLTGHRALNEENWEVESDPLENNEEYFSIPLYAQVDPFREIGADGPTVVPMPAVPDGWVMVPREPTVAMLEAVAGGPVYTRTMASHDLPRAMYRAMLAAAPPAPQAETAPDVVGLVKLEAQALRQVEYFRDKQRGFPALEDFMNEDDELELPADITPLLSGAEANGRYSEANWWLSTIRAARQPARVTDGIVELRMTPIGDGLPVRDELRGEQTILTYNDKVGTWAIDFMEAGWDDYDSGFAIGVSHWLDITSMWPGVIAQVASFSQPVQVDDAMVERAARALCQLGTSFPTIELTHDWVDRKWPRFKSEADAALTAAVGGGE